jgi:hypothetical protein
MDMWDVFQQSQISSASVTADNAADKANRTSEKLHHEIRRLDSKIEGLALVCEALWELLREHSNLTDADVRTKMHEIDIRDGRADGRMTGQPYDCPTCNRPVHTTHSRCIWCNTELNTTSVAKTAW